MKQLISLDDMVISFDNYRDIHAELSEIAPSGYLLALEIRMFSPALLFTSYPEAWTRHYIANGFALRDPILHWSTFNDGLIRWSEIMLGWVVSTFYTERVMDNAKDHGLVYGGLCVKRVNGDSGYKSYISVARSDREITDEEMLRVEHLFEQIIDSWSSEGNLSRGEITVLEMLAEGHTQDQIAEAVNLTRAGVKRRLEKARITLGATNSVHAVAIAIKKGLVKP